MANKWNTFYWDDDTVWDATDASDANLLWGIEVDWDGDGIFSGDNEALNCIGFEMQRGRQNYIRLSEGEANGFAYMEPGTCTILLDNTSGRYSSRNASGPLYPNVRPGKLLKVTVTYNDVQYARFAGRIVDIRQVGTQTVQLWAVDGMRELGEQAVNVALQKTLTISTALGLIMDEINWPTAWGRSIDTTSETLPYWWTTGQRALTELRNLADAETGQFYCKANGAAAFASRNHIGTLAATLTEADVLKEINFPVPWEVVRNDIQITVRPRVIEAAVDVWRLEDKPQLAAGEVKYYFAQTAYGGNCPVDNIIAPVANTDYTANTSADGTGTDKTSEFSVVATNLGSTTMLRVQAGASTAYITLLKLRGDAVVAGDETIVQDVDASSQSTYGVLKFKLANDWMQLISSAENLADWLITYLPNSTDFPQVQIQNRPALQFAPDLFDNVDAAFPTLGLNSTTYRVAYIRERWASENGQNVVTDFHLESFASLPVYWIFDATMEVTTIFPP